MGIEGPSKDELAKAYGKAFEEADPTSYSRLPPKGELTRIGTPKSLGLDPHKTNSVVEIDGNLFYEIHPGFAKNNGFRQQAVARLLKGILNVSDVVMRDDESGTRFYSRGVPLDRIEHTHTDDEAQADLELLSIIFDDIDHSVAPIASRDESVIDYNARSEKGKVAYYDFGSARVQPHAPGKLSGRTLSHAALNMLSGKLDDLEERIQEGNKSYLLEGIYIDAVRKGHHLGRDLDDFEDILRWRVGNAKVLVQAAIKKLGQKQGV